MPEQIARIALWILAAVFAWSGFAKILGPLPWRRSLVPYRLPRTVRLLIAALVPIVELAVPVLVLTGRSRAGGSLAIGFLAGASLMVLRLRSLEGDEVPCGCFGGTKSRDYRALLARNAVIGALAAIVTLSPEHLASRNDLLSDIDFIPVALVVAGVFVIMGLVRVGASLGRWHR